MQQLEATLGAEHAQTQRLHHEMAQMEIKRLSSQAQESETARLRAACDVLAVRQELEAVQQAAHSERRQSEEKLRQLSMDRDSLAAMLREVLHR